MATKQAESMNLSSHIIDLEQSLQSPLVRSNPRQVASLLHPEFTEYGRSGTVYNKQQILQLMEKETLSEVKLVTRQFDLIELSEHLVQLTYQSAIEVVQSPFQFSNLK